MSPSVETSYQLVMEFLAWLRLPVAAEPCDLNILCLQGAAPTPGHATRLELNDNRDNLYNDTVLLASRSIAGAPQFASFLGTVDPGTAVDVPGGVAHLTFGQHLYRPGLHLKTYPCLRALNEQNRIWRRRENGELYVQTGAFGVNVHAGGTGPQVGNWSLGCINICGGWDGAPYLHFLDLVRLHFGVAPGAPLGSTGQRRGSVGVTIWSARDFARFAAEGWSARPTLRLGMHGPWVAQLQAQLERRGHLIGGTVDSDFGTVTVEAVRRLQLAHGLPADGIAGPATWTALSSESVNR